MAKTNPDAMDGAASVASAPASWTLTVGRMNLRRDGKDQPDYNLLVLDDASKSHVAYWANKHGFDPANQDGEIFVVVQVDQKTKNALRQAMRVHGNKLLVSGNIVLQDVIANRLQGRFTATEIGPVTLDNGGRTIVLGEDELAERREKRAERRAAFSTGR